MAAQTLGSISFGMVAEVGFFIASASFNYSIDEKTIRDEQGEHVAAGRYGSVMSFSLEGSYKTTGSPNFVLGAALVIANIPTHTSFVPSYTSGGKVSILGADVSLGNEKEQERTLSGKFYTFMAAS